MGQVVGVSVTSRCMDRLPDTCTAQDHADPHSSSVWTKEKREMGEDELRVERAKSNIVLPGDRFTKIRVAPSLSYPKLIDTLGQIAVSGGKVVFKLDLHNELARMENLKQYFDLCTHNRRLQVTTSCFAAWRKSKKLNGFAKVIPVARAEDLTDLTDDLDDLEPNKPHRPVRVFFFDDNLEWGGSEDSPGICNLRDVATGKFVNFAEGQNGFVQERFARHTVVQHSQLWRTVLVKANILDAIEDHEYFAKLITQFSEPSDKLIVFMDVNATIVCSDTVQGKDLSVTLLGTMFELLEFKPYDPPCDLKWGTLNPIRVEKVKTLKGLIKDMTLDDHEAYTQFWQEKTCWDFLAHVLSKGEVRWVTGTEPMSVKSVRDLFMSYLDAVPGALDADGITKSWFHLYSKLQGSHSTVLNSFGVDTRKVTLATISEEKEPLHIAINHEMWDERDVKKFADQFH